VSVKSISSRALGFLEILQKFLAPWLGVFRIREFVNFLLSFCPLRLKLDGVVLSIRCWSDCVACLEIFQAHIYDQVFLMDRVQTYCDLGCQSGFAWLRLTALQGAPAESLLVDGNPLAVTRCKKNLSASSSCKIHLIHGVVGWDAEVSGPSVPFTVRPNELECSLAPEPFPHQGSEIIEVPVVNLEKEWLYRIGRRSCDLLKIDIEGAEGCLLRSEPAFFARVKRCVLEWHGGTTNKREIISLLKGLGFGEVKMLWESPRAGVLTCRNLIEARPSGVKG